MIQKRLAKPTKDVGLKKPYSYGAYNKANDKEQWIRLSQGCPNQCPFCYEPEKPEIYPIPPLVRNDVKIMDMNLLAKPEAMEIIRELGRFGVNGKPINYELICGIDYRFLTKDLAFALKNNRFKNIRLAWDWEYSEQKRIQKAIEMLKNAGYKTGENTDITVFMICNWKIPYQENLKKMDLCKVWNVKIADCYFDNQISPNIVPIHWTKEQITDFRHKVRKHNQLVNFGIDPEAV